MVVEIRYGVTFGKCDSSDWIDWEVELTDEEAIAYQNAIDNEIPLNEVLELQGALQRVYEEIENEEIRIGIDNGDEYVMLCQGEAQVDPSDINSLIDARDPYTLSFFGLLELSEDELANWTAYELETLPLIKDFVQGFEPYSPYDEGWTLKVEFVDPK